MGSCSPKKSDLTTTRENLYHLCLKDLTDEIREAWDHKARWHQMMDGKGFRMKLALDDAGRVGGMIQYLPIEHSFADGKKLYLILCLWFHGHKKGHGNFQERGMRKDFLQAAEVDVKALGAKGLAA